MDNNTIAGHTQACAIRFNVLASSSSSSGSLSPPAFEDQLARFSIWAANVGAFAEAHGSLDYRLRESPKIKNMMMQLLIGLKRKLQRAMDSTEETKTKGFHSKLDRTSEDADSECDENATELEESISSQSSSSPSVSEPIARFVPLMKHLKGIEAAIDRLHRLAMTIRGSSIHHRKSNTSNFVLRDENGNDISSQFEHFAIRMVETRYPKANPLLHLRLGQVILQRRKRFAYQQRHQQKLALPARATPMPPSARQLQHTGSVRDANFPHPGRADSPNVQRIFPHGHARRTVLSTTTASALTLGTFRSRPPSSTFSSSTVATTNDAQNLYYPPRPRVTPGSKEFQCPYCGLVLGLEAGKGTRWKKHIINDLEPYICLFEHCTKLNEAFRTVGDWLQHMQGEHNIGWYCNSSECHDQMFDCQVDFEEHMKSLHAETFNPSQLPIISESSRRPATELFEQCPLCDHVPTVQELNVWKREGTRNNTGENLKILPKHIAVHLEELALLSLPWQDDLDTAGSSKKTRYRGSKNSDREFILDDISLTFEDPSDANVISGHEGKTDIPIAEPFNTSRESEWGFWPLPDYEGHMKDPFLRLLVDGFLRRRIEEADIVLGDVAENQNSAGGFDPDTASQLDLGMFHHKYLDWISPMVFASRQTEILGTRLEGTCQWFFETLQFQSWISGVENRLWYCGIPGSGKTVLASAVIEDLQQRCQTRLDMSLAFVYCDWRLGKIQSTIALIASLLRQFLETHWQVKKSVPESIQASIDRHRRANTRPSLKEYLEFLTVTIANFTSAFIVIDAFDECSETTRAELFNELRAVRPSMRILFTSRSSGEVELGLAKSLRIESYPNDTEIKNYAQKLIEQKVMLVSRMKALSVSQQDEILSKIVQSAGGVFLVAQSLVQCLADTDISPDLVDFPKAPYMTQLCAIYGDTLDRIKMHSTEAVQVATRSLAWLTYCKRPLTPGELQHAIAVQDVQDDSLALEEAKPSPVMINTVCVGMVIIEAESNIVRLAHHTMRDYLHSVGPDFFPYAMQNITKACLAYLSIWSVKNGPCETDKALIDRLYRYPFLTYAAKEWGNHARGFVEHDCEEDILMFLGNELAVQGTVQAYSIPSDWQAYPQAIESNNFPRAVSAIGLAASFGLKAIVDAILYKEGSSISDSDKVQALFWAATEGFDGVVELMLANGVDVSAPGVLAAAARNGRLSVIQILLNRGTDVNSRSEERASALQAAALKGNESIIKTLLEHGADPDIDGGELGSVLHIAAVNGDESIIRLLLNYGANVNAKGGMYGYALQAAVEEGHENIIRLLLDQGADVNLEGGPYGNALQAAAENGNETIVELLLAAGADINVKIGGERYTALQEVARRGLEEMVALLLGHGANIASQQRNGQTALFMAAKEGHAEVVALLLSKGANLNTRDERNLTPLDWAIKKKHTKVIAVLKDARR